MPKREFKTARYNVVRTFSLEYQRYDDEKRFTRVHMIQECDVLANDQMEALKFAAEALDRFHGAPPPSSATYQVKTMGSWSNHPDDKHIRDMGMEYDSSRDTPVYAKARG